MKSPRFLIFAALAFAPCAPRVWAQAAPTDANVVADPLAADLEKFGVMFKRGFYDELVFNINRSIAQSPAAKPDPRLLYFRGLSYYKLGWFDRAKPDLLAAQEAKIASLPGGFGTKWGLQYIEERTPFLPPKLTEVRDGERAIFRMHHYSMEGGTAMIMGILPQAYRINRQIFGSDVEETTIYVFDDYSQFTAYYKQVRDGKNPGSWYSAVTMGDLLLLTLRDKDGVLRARDKRMAFQKTVVHEFNHAMLNRLMGTATQPSWFKEGLAQVAGAQVDTQFDAREQETLRRMFEYDALLPISVIGPNASFAEQTELGIKMRKTPDKNRAPDPYTQGYGMVKYLLDNISTAQLQSFLNRVRASEDFDGSFAEEFGFSLDQFYEGWKRDTAQKLAAG